jgi:hypothetical protein
MDGEGYQLEHSLRPEGGAVTKPQSLVTPMPKPKGKVGRPRNSDK